MTETTDIATKDTKPISNIFNSHLFTLRYKHRNATQERRFYATTLDEAIARARKHCTTQRFKFIYVEPFATDLDEADRRLQEAQGEYQADKVLEHSEV